MGLGTSSIRLRGADVGYEAIVVGVICSLGGFLFGFDTGQISGFQLFEDFINRFGQTQADGTRAFTSIILSLIVSLMSVGSLVGALAGSYSADYLGRRKSIVTGVVIFLIGNLLQITAMYSWAHLTVGRFVAGIGVGVISIGVPLYESEVCPKEIRGAVVASYQLAITIGILVSNCCNLGVREIQDSSASWRIVIGIGMAFSIPLLTVLVLPESPRHLMGERKWDEARLAMARLRGVKGDTGNEFVERDFTEMYESLKEEENAGTGSWLECFTGQPSGIPKMVYRTWLGMLLHFSQQWSGVNYFFYYGATIFNTAGVDDPIVTQLILGAVNTVCTIPGLWILMRFGRRKPLYLGGLWQAAWLLIFATIATAQPPTTDNNTGTVMIVAGCMYIASFAATWGPACWVVIGESFSLRTRAKQVALATASNWLANFMISFLTPLADAGISYAYGYVFVGMNLFGAALVYFFLYETEGLTLEAVDIMYSDPKVNARNSKDWVPAGYRDRKTRIDEYFADDATRVGSEDLARGKPVVKPTKGNGGHVEKV